MLHEPDIDYFERLKTIGYAIAKQDNIRVACIEPKRRAGGAVGLAYVMEDRICIQVRDKKLKSDGGEWAKQRYQHDFNLTTLAHELAHIKEYQLHGKTNHGKRFKEYEAELKEAVLQLDKNIN